MVRKVSSFLLGSCALLGASVASAQDVTSGGAVLEEITVTAQRRAQNIQDAPLSVQALTADSLAAAGVGGTQNLQSAVPGLVFNNNLTAALPYIRGVGQNTGSLGVESPVAMYIDGVYLVGPANGIFNLTNVERVEVAKGPQGTLFGRNTTGGVIHVITREPEQELSWSGGLGYGNFDTRSANAYVTTGVGSNLATSLSGYYEDRNEGYINNVFLNQELGQSENYGVQNKWLWDASEQTELGLNLFYNYRSGFQGTTNAVYEGDVADDRVTGHLGPYTTSAGIPTPNLDEQWLAALTLRHDFGWARLTNIASYHDLRDRFNFVQNAEPLHDPFLIGRAAVTQYVFGSQETVTEELQLQSQADADLQWTAGLFYLHDRTGLDVLDYRENQFIFQGSGANDIVSRQETDSYAAYLDGSKTIFGKTRLTLGARYSKDEKEVTGRVNTVTASGAIVTTTPAAPGGTFAPLETPKSWAEWSYRAVLDHHFNEDVMGYVSYNRGFKSGLYNITVFFNQPVDPEIVDAFEVGLKNELFGRRLRLNVAAYYYDYKDVQLRQTVSAFPGRFLLLNAADATVQGIDADFSAVVTENLRIDGGISYLDAKYDNFPGAPVAIPNPVSLPLPAGCSVVGAALPPSAAFVGGNTTVSCNLVDSRMIRSPEITGNLGVRYTANFSSGAKLTFSVNDHYNDGFLWDADGRLRQEAYHDVSASITWALSSGRWDVTMWGRNLADEEIHATASAGGTTTFAPGLPRTYGISFNVRN